MAGNLESSVMAVTLCKEAGVPTVIAKCGNEMPEGIARCEVCGCPMEETVPTQTTETEPQAPYQYEVLHTSAESMVNEPAAIDKQAIRKKIKTYRIWSTVCLILGSTTLVTIISNFMCYYAPSFFFGIFNLIFGCFPLHSLGTLISIFKVAVLITFFVLLTIRAKKMSDELEQNTD